jgi:class 3 adenylate cyclase
VNSVRRLAAILAADVVGYSRLMEADEEGTLSRLRSVRANLLDPKIAEYRGRIVKTTGDGLLAEFHSVVDALRCAAEIQQTIAGVAQPPDRKIQFRIGIHQGDIVFTDNDIFGDGVNVAARLEGIAEPGGICVSARVQEDAAGKLDLGFDYIGEQALKNISRPVKAYRVRSANRLAGVAERTVIRTRPGVPTSPTSTAAGILQPGMVLGHTYAIEALLGRGTLGEIYRAKHVELGTSHAIKVLAPSLGGDPKFVQLLVEEARKLAQVHHDAIVAYEGLFRDERGLRYLVMEFVDGPSLRTILAGRRFETDEVLRLRDRLAAGLAAVHAHGIIHRDVSPDNITLPGGEIGRAKLIDFGFATTPGAGDPTLIGTNLAQRHAFASPEQLGLFGGQVDSRSDIYSLGLVLAAAAIGFGRSLDMGATPAAAIAARQKEPDLASVPPVLRSVIAPMLAPRPEDRTASVRALLEGGASATEARDTGHGRRTPGRRGAWMIGFGAAAVAALVAVGLAVVLLRPATPTAGLDALREQLAAATAGYTCGSVKSTVAPSRTVQLTGHVASVEDLSRLRGSVAAIPGVGSIDFAVEVMEHPHCDVAGVLGSLAEGGRDHPALAFTSQSGATYIGGQPSLDVRGPGFDSYIYIDYFDSGSGQVLHLFPNARERFNLRPWRNHFVLFKSRLWTICGNVGRQLITMVAAPRPLFPTDRPDVEPAPGYISSLGQALQGIPKDKAAALLFFDLRDAPPWINRDAVCPSG